MQQVSGFDIIDISNNDLKFINYQIEDYKNDIINFYCENITIKDISSLNKFLDSMLLKNFDITTKYFDYHSKNELQIASDPKIKGWYKYINGIVSALLVMDNNLYLIQWEKEIVIKESYKVLLKENSHREGEFFLVNEEDIMIKFQYELPDPNLNVSPFEYIDEEDFNWGAFIERIINDKERQQDFINIFNGK